VDDDPDNVTRIRTALSEAARDLILLKETNGYMKVGNPALIPKPETRNPKPCPKPETRNPKT